MHNFGPCQSGLNLHHRYIDQCLELLDAPTTMGERKDLEVYSMAVRTAMGEVSDWEEETPKEFISYVERGSTQYLEGVGRKEGLPVTYNYERWLGGA
jgi:hypothetical protein